MGHISLGEGNTYGLLPACSGDGTRPARLSVLSPPGAAVRPSAYGRHRAGSSRQPAVILRSVRDLAALVLFQPDGDELAGAATDDHLGPGASAVRHPADLVGAQVEALRTARELLGFEEFRPGQEEAIKTQWAQVENQLQRRNDLIGNLVETVKGYAKQEKDVLVGVTRQVSGEQRAQRMKQSRSILDSLVKE